MGKIDFGGVAKQACLEHLPNAAIGDYVLVHVGFALAKVEEAEAQQIFSFLDRMDELKEVQSDESTTSADFAIDSDFPGSG